MEEMNLFGSVEHNDDNSDKWQDLPENPTNQDMLDYMALVIARSLDCHKAFKGGYMLNQLLSDYSRMTHDIDFSIMDKKQYETAKVLLAELGDYFIKKGIASSYKIKDTITEDSSGGIDIYKDEKEGSRKILGMDIGLHDIRYGIEKYHITIGDVDAFEVERMLSDKLTAILSRKRFRRTKDLYDFYIITNAFDINLQKLYDYVCKHDQVEWENIPFNDIILTEYRKAWDKLKLMDMSEVDLDKPSFEVVLKRFYGIALPLKRNEIGGKWDHVNRQISRRL